MANVNKRTRDGMTPLMKACQNFQRDKVRALLDSGANPNKRCRKTKNTPLHFACGLKKGTKCSSWNYPIKMDEEELPTRIGILQMLLERGAVIKDNKDGLSPLTLAAVYGFKDIVQFFEAIHIVDENVRNLDFAKAYDLLGASCTVFLSADHAEDHADFAEECFEKADAYRKELHHGRQPPADDNLTDFEKCFTSEERKESSYEQRFVDIYVKGMMAAVKILPHKLKKELVWENVASFATRAMFEGEFYGMETGFRLFQYMINLEIEGILTLGKVLNALSEYIVNTIDPVPSSVMMCTSRLLQMYAERLHKRGKYTMRRESFPLFSYLGLIIGEIACYHRKAADLELVLPAAIMITKKVFRAFQGCLFGRPRDLSITREVLEAVTTIYTLDYGGGQGKAATRRLLHAIRRLLPCDSGIQSKSQDYCSGTMLHLLMALSSISKSVHGLYFLTSAARLLIRYGCSITEVNVRGETPKQALLRECQKRQIDHTKPEYEELLQLLSPALSPLTLEEKACRVVLKARIPYKGKVPETLSELLDGGSTIHDISELDSPESSEAERESD